MKVEAMVSEVNQDFLESTGDFHTTANIVNALNEGYGKFWRAMARRDRAGVYFGVEEPITYDADSRSVKWADKLDWGLVRLHSLENVSGGASKPGKPYRLIDRRNEYRETGRTSDTLAMITQSALFLTTSGGPPGSDLSLRVVYTPAPILMKSSGTVALRAGGAPVAWANYEPEFLVGMESVLIAYAVARLSIAEERQEREVERRYDMLERQLLAAIDEGLQTQDLPEIQVADPTAFQVYDY